MPRPFRFPSLSRPRGPLSMVACLALVAFTSACDGSAGRITDPAPWVGERTLTVGNTTLHARVDRAPFAPEGPTIVLMSGLDTPLDVWGNVRLALSANGPVFSYDRGGIGRSGPVGPLRPSSVVADELHVALTEAGLRPPYLLVAHSIAGLHARVFAHRHPSLVAGVVLVDATHETLLDLLGPEDVEAIADAQQFPGARAEVRAQAASVAEVRLAPLPNVPLVVLTSMTPEPGQTPEVRDWLASLQAEWLTQVDHGEQVRLPVGHMIPLEAPGAVVSAARRVLALRAGTLEARPATHRASVAGPFDRLR